MNQRLTLLFAAALGGLAVVTGAFGAHALRDMLTTLGRMETFETAVRYQFYHALALMLTGLLIEKYAHKTLRLAALTFLLGMVFFCGSLYLLCFLGVTAFGAVAPLGGTLFVVGWASLLIAVYQGPTKNEESHP
jgi:uncharacterized membrane protein YgdD (TMEM256/DUF423 family)